MMFDEDEFTKLIDSVCGHIRTVCIHKYWVAKYCFRAGLYWRGIKHDLSKFTPVEFIESVKYYAGGKGSPINKAKADKGWSAAWMNHKGRNTHHYEYWQDNFDSGGEAIEMPFECAAELVCDYLGAARAYMGKKFTYLKEYIWWMDKYNRNIAMHPHIKEFVNLVMMHMARIEVNRGNAFPGIDPDKYFTHEFLKSLYDNTFKIKEWEDKNPDKPEMEAINKMNAKKNLDPSGVSYSLSEFNNGIVKIKCNVYGCDNCNPYEDDGQCMYAVTPQMIKDYKEGKFNGCKIIKKHIKQLLKVVPMTISCECTSCMYHCENGCSFKSSGKMISDYEDNSKAFKYCAYIERIIGWVKEECKEENKK